MRRPRLLLVLVLAAALALGAGCDGGEEPRRAGGTARLQDLHGIDQLRELFNESRGVPRLILILSPT